MFGPSIHDWHPVHVPRIGLPAITNQGFGQRLGVVEGSFLRNSKGCCSGRVRCDLSLPNLLNNRIPNRCHEESFEECCRNDLTLFRIDHSSFETAQTHSHDRVLRALGQI